MQLLQHLNHTFSVATETRALQQKKIFTNWINAQLELADQMDYEEPFIGSYLQGGTGADNIEARLALIFKGDKSPYRVKDLYKDLSDGRVLLRLLEFFTGRKVSLNYRQVKWIAWLT